MERHRSPLVRGPQVRTPDPVLPTGAPDRTSSAGTVARVLTSSDPSTADDGDSDPASDAEPGDADTAAADDRAGEIAEARNRRRVPLVVVVAGAVLVLGAGVGALLVMLGVFDSEPERPEASEELVAAFERCRLSVYAVDGEFTRTLPDGRQLSSGALIVQRPPDELRRQLGGMSGRVNGRRVNCSTGPDGRFSCAPGAEVPEWDEQVAREVANLRSYFDAEHPIYEAVALGDGCFELTLVAIVDDPTYGERGILCFDAASGAMRSLEVHHANGAVDRLEASAIRGVRPEDFSFEGDAAFEATPDGG
jgi:hypothetical protein